jgi:hypothetical protein
LIHNGLQVETKGELHVEVLKDKQQITEYKWNLTIPALTVVKIKTLTMPSELGTLVRLKYKDSITQQTGENFHFPAMEQYREKSSRIKDLINVRFDGWWRKHMTKLMELDRIRTEVKDWDRKKKLME